MHPGHLFTRLCAACSLAVALLAHATSSLANPSPPLEEGSTLVLAREATLNGVTLAKGSELVITKVTKDAAGEVARVDVQEPAGQKRIFKALTPEAVRAMASAGAAGGSGGRDRGEMFKVGAQIPLLHKAVLGGMEFASGSVLQIERVYKDKGGKIAKLDVRETEGKKRMVRGLTVEEVAFALVPDDVSWPDGAVGRSITLGDPLTFGGEAFTKGAKLVVTRVVTDAKGGVIKVDLREADAPKRQLSDVPVALLKQNGALGTASGAPR